MKYNRLNPIHWVLSFFSNSRKTTYLGKVPDYRAADYDATRRIFYFFRNPAHDFCSYIIGFREDDRYTTVYGNALDTNMNGWIVAVRKWGWLRLPFISYMGLGIQTYAGWRPGGDFGLKLKRKK